MSIFKNGLQYLFIQKNNRFLVQFIRYFFVGGFAFVVDFAALVFFKEVCGLQLIISNTLSFTLGLLVNYFISIFWVFTNSKVKSRRLEFIFFAIIAVVGLGLSDVLLWIFTDYAGICYLTAKTIVSVIVWQWNFLARKYLLFGQSISNKSNENE